MRDSTSTRGSRSSARGMVGTTSSTPESGEEALSGLNPAVLSSSKFEEYACGESGYSPMGAHARMCEGVAFQLGEPVLIVVGHVTACTSAWLLHIAWAYVAHLVCMHTSLAAYSSSCAFELAFRVGG